MNTLKEFIDDIGVPKSSTESSESEGRELTGSKTQPVKKQEQEPGLLSQVMRYAKLLQVEKIDITTSYYQWVKIGYGLANSFGEKGLSAFHVISSAGYNAYKKEEAEKLYADCLKCTCEPRQPKVTGGTVIRLIREAGVRLYAGRRKEEHESNSEVAFDIIQDKYPSVFDTLSQDVLVNGKPIDDTVLNTILVDLMANHGLYTTKEFVQAVLESSFTETVNQFDDFVAKYYNCGKIDNGGFVSDNIKKLADCIKSRTGKNLGFEFGYKEEVIKLFMQKMIAQLFDNVPNDLCLILLGGPFIGKTEFFKRLLPDELQHLFSVQAFKGDKDSKRDAARYMLILDDEFRGLKMATSEALKSQLSLTTINLRVPYGRKPHPFKRIASYCAVSNERFILKDPTGNRRLICLWVDSIDWELYNSIDKVDLIMEAYHDYRMGFDHNLTREMLGAINLVSRDFETTTSAEELLIQFHPPGTKGDTGLWKSVSEIISDIRETTKVTLTDYEVGKALRKLDYLHKYQDVNGSKLLCWLVKKGGSKFSNFEYEPDQLF